MKKTNLEAINNKDKVMHIFMVINQKNQCLIQIKLH